MAISRVELPTDLGSVSSVNSLGISSELRDNFTTLLEHGIELRFRQVFTMPILVVKAWLNCKESVAHIDHAFNDESFVLFTLRSMREIIELFKDGLEIILNRIGPHFRPGFQARFVCLITARLSAIIQYLIPELFPEPIFSLVAVKTVG